MKPALSPVEKAAQVYQDPDKPCVRTFKQDLEFHLLNGFVFSRPDFFVMGRPVVSGAPRSYIVGQHRFPSRFCDCWHVYLMAGNIAKAWTMLPWELPLVSFERDYALRFHRLASIRRLSGGLPVTTK